jgi:hypothetical protein
MASAMCANGSADPPRCPSPERQSCDRTDRKSEEDRDRDESPEEESSATALHRRSPSAAVLFAVGEKPHPQRLAVVAGCLHRLQRFLPIPFAGGEFQVFGGDISLIRSKGECQDDVVLFRATHRDVYLRPLDRGRPFALCRAPGAAASLRFDIKVLRQPDMDVLEREAAVLPGAYSTYRNTLRRVGYSRGLSNARVNSQSASECAGEASTPGIASAVSPSVCRRTDHRFLWSVNQFAGPNSPEPPGALHSAPQMRTL